MKGIYNYIPEKNHVSWAYSVAAVLYLQFVLHVMSFRMWNMFCMFVLLLSTVCVLCLIWLLFAVPWFCAVLVCWIRNGLNDSEMIPVAPVITGINFAYYFYLCIIIIIIIIIIISCSLCFLRLWHFTSSWNQTGVILKLESGVCNSSVPINCKDQDSTV